MSTLVPPAAPLALDVVSKRHDCRGTETQSADVRSLRVTLIVPTLNEAESLPFVLAELPPGLHEVIIVDGHSTDRTREIVEGFGAPFRFVTQPGKGKGDALRLGFELATGDVLITLDADGSMNPREIQAFVGAISRGADAALGSRYLFGGASEDMTWLRNFGNYGLRTLTNVLFRVKFTDVTYGYNAFSARAMRDLIQLGGEFEIETVNRLMVLRASLPWIEVPCVERQRFFGESRLQPFRAGVRIARSIMALRLLPVSYMRPPRAGRV
jgi:glycosyltransferase involved in cell wall biosynthesis